MSARSLIASAFILYSATVPALAETALSCEGKFWLSDVPDRKDDHSVSIRVGANIEISGIGILSVHDANANPVRASGVVSGRYTDFYHEITLDRYTGRAFITSFSAAPDFVRRRGAQLRVSGQDFSLAHLQELSCSRATRLF